MRGIPSISCHLRCRFVLLTAVCSVGASQVATAQSYDNVVVFGDSLSDDGNTAGLTFGFVPGPAPYWNGRFSNGPVWTEHLANWVGADLENYAHGGAQAADGFTTYVQGFFSINIPNTGGQFDQFDADQGGGSPPSTDLSADLFVINAGSVNYATQGETGTAPVDFISDLIDSLYDLGAREFLVSNLPDIGVTPDGLDETEGPSSADLTSYVMAHNAELILQLDALRGMHADINLIEFDAFTLLADVVANPSDYGISNVTDSAMDSTSITDPNDPFWDDYLWFDGSHPTDLVHEQLATEALAALIPAAVPEPSSALLALFGLLLACARRRS